MTALTMSQQEEINKLADDTIAESKKKAYIRLGWMSALTCVTMFAATFAAPPVVVMLAAVGGLFSAMLAAGQGSTIRHMGKLKDDVKQDDAIERMKARKDKLMTKNDRAAKISLYGMVGFVGSIIGMALAPPLAPVLALTKFVGSLAWFGGSIVRELSEGPIRETGVLVHAASKLVDKAADDAYMAANQNAPAAVVGVPAPAQSFNRNGGNAAPETGFVDDKPPSPKIGGLGM